MLKVCTRENEKITVVMPLFNDKLFKWTLEGFCNQTSDKFKLIIVNDGGSDFDQLISQYSKKINLEYYYLFSPDDLYCVGTAKNLGAYHAKTQRIVFLDSDCIPSKHFVERNLIYNSEKMITAGIRFRISKAKQKEIQNIDTIPQLAGSIDDRYLDQPQWRKDRLKNIHKMEQGKGSFPLYCHGFCVNCLTQDFKAIGGFSRAFEGYSQQDQDLALRLCKLKGYTTLLDKQIQCFHLDHNYQKKLRNESKLNQSKTDTNPVRNNGKLIWYNYERKL